MMEDHVWQISEPDAVGIECHSLVVPGPYESAYETARIHAYERIASLPNGSLLHPPGIAGRGDHVVVELHVRAPTPAVEAIALAPLLPSS